MAIKEYYTIPEGCKTAQERFTENDWRALIHANDEIGKRIGYGIREETASCNGTHLTWSNGGKQWVTGYTKIKKGRQLRLDANEIFLPLSPERAHRIQPCLRDLPLYYCSSEAQSRGEVSWDEAGMEWAIRQLARLLGKKPQELAKEWDL